MLCRHCAWPVTSTGWVNREIRVEFYVPLDTQKPQPSVHECAYDWEHSTAHSCSLTLALCSIKDSTTGDMDLSHILRSARWLTASWQLWCLRHLLGSTNLATLLWSTAKGHWPRVLAAGQLYVVTDWMKERKKKRSIPQLRCYLLEGRGTTCTGWSSIPWSGLGNNILRQIIFFF